MRKIQTLTFVLAFLSLAFVSQAQNTPFGKVDSLIKPGYNLWGYAFMDYYYKGHGDTAGTFNGSYKGRGGSNQYTGVPSSHSAFQSRRIYLGFDYTLNKSFQAEFLLADEDNYNDPSTATSPQVPNGDLLANGKSSFYLKLANIRWHNIWKGTDFVFGQQATPSFPLLTEVVWGYRSIERTVSDIRRTPSYDFGAGLNGIFDPATRNFGYDLLVANGTSAKPEPFTNNFKWFYGDVWAKFFNKHLLLDFYADYYRYNWTPAWHNSRQMLKGYVAYTTPKLTIGVEAFMNTLKKDAFLTKTAAAGGGVDTADAVAQAISAYVRGSIIKNTLGFFVRVDKYNPNSKLTSSNITNYSKEVGHVSNYIDPALGNANTVQETFLSAGLDLTPIKNVHIMPNVWYDHYHTLGNPASGPDNHDVVYRMTFYYIYGK
ncbi:hypothetical protein [Dinghuibacter silviterrae]|uniref:OmpL-like beta-barrel porin-2 n=1 Tax=Dinghuibacter silviterrae TaxID=1539049 RepID=A0A4V3GM33_9BACT|nr:hypothetical protein [Dinghuibacter silviterrae]TDX01883.1 hypothetical protein EDB95_2927 [Dinghuibacter silviterrae]